MLVSADCLLLHNGTIAADTVGVVPTFSSQAVNRISHSLEVRCFTGSPLSSAADAS